MEGSPFLQSPCAFNAAPFSSGFGSPFGAAFPSPAVFNTTTTFPSSPPFLSSSSSTSSPFSYNTTGRIRSRDCFEAQQQNAQPTTHFHSSTPISDDRNNDLSWPSPIKKRKQNMDIEKQEAFGEPNTSTREKRKRWGTDEVADNPLNKVDRTQKQRKLIHKKPDAKDIPKARNVHVRFGPDILQTVEAKILYKEPWGVMVRKQYLSFILQLPSSMTIQDKCLSLSFITCHFTTITLVLCVLLSYSLYTFF